MSVTACVSVFESSASVFKLSASVCECLLCACECEFVRVSVDLRMNGFE